MNVECIACGALLTEKDTLGINKKLLGRRIKKFYCMDCLADYLHTTVDDLLEMIEHFRDSGCALFK